MMKRVVAVAAIVAVTGCTPREVRMWSAWHDEDPAAAEAFAQALPPEPVNEALAASRYGLAVWAKIGRCESGNQAHHAPVRNRFGVYSGEFMISHSVWRVYGGAEFASAPYLASRAQQIVVAERIADDVGLDRGWQCWP